MSESLQDRLRDHAKAFDGLLSLIPAKMYYGDDNTDQWKKTKQSKKEAAAARKAKLDPDSAMHRNAKEVMDERARNKRQQRLLNQITQKDEEEDIGGEESEEEEDFEVMEGVEVEKPGEGLKKKESTPSDEIQPDVDEEEDVAKNENEDVANAVEKPKLSKKEEKKAAKREKKAEKRAEKKAEKKTNQDSIEGEEPTESSTAQAETTTHAPNAKDKKLKKIDKAIKALKEMKEEDTAKAVAEETVDKLRDGGLDPSIDFSGLQREEDGSAASALESEPHSPTFDSSEIVNANSAEAGSTTTSISSTVPPSEKPKHLKIPADTSALRARLAAKIEALRAARKADGPDGKPIRTRQELIESRREKEAKRKAHKKELRKIAKEEELRKREETLASNSPGIMSPRVGLDDTTGFSFGRVAFADGSQMSHDLSYFLNRDKKKGPSDPKTALLKVQNQKKRFEELDPEKQKDIAEKEAWLTARRRVEGEKIKDDENLLKKAVKRKETAKKKSEKAWKERSSGVAQAQKERQKKREDNIRQRREDKILKRSGKKKKGGATKKKGGRPGFEGSLGVGGKRK